MGLGIMLTIVGFISWRKRDDTRMGCCFWSIAFVVTLLITMPVLCTVVPLPDGRAGPTSEAFGQMTKGMAFWAMVPGVALSAGGLVSLLFLFKRKKKDQADVPEESDLSH